MNDTNFNKTHSSKQNKNTFFQNFINKKNLKKTFGNGPWLIIVSIRGPNIISYKTPVNSFFSVIIASVLDKTAKWGHAFIIFKPSPKDPIIFSGFEAEFTKKMRMKIAINFFKTGFSTFKGVSYNCSKMEEYTDIEKNYKFIKKKYMSWLGFELTQSQANNILKNITNIAQNKPNYSFHAGNTGLNCTSYIIKLLNDSGILEDKLFDFKKLFRLCKIKLKYSKNLSGYDPKYYRNNSFVEYHGSDNEPTKNINLFDVFLYNNWLSEKENGKTFVLDDPQLLFYIFTFLTNTFISEIDLLADYTLFLKKQDNLDDKIENWYRALKKSNKLTISVKNINGVNGMFLHRL